MARGDIIVYWSEEHGYEYPPSEAEAKRMVERKGGYYNLFDPETYQCRMKNKLLSPTLKLREDLRP